MGQGGKAGASLKWAVTAEPTQAQAKRPLSQRDGAEKGGGFVPRSVRDLCGYPPSRAPRPHPQQIHHSGNFFWQSV